MTEDLDRLVVIHPNGEPDYEPADLGIALRRLETMTHARSLAFSVTMMLGNYQVSVFALPWDAGGTPILLYGRHATTARQALEAAEAILVHYASKRPAQA